jgi:hypothetical protein
MSVFEKHRFKIFNNAQHPYQHTLSDYNYQNDRLPGVNNLNDVLDNIIASIYPNYKATVATIGDLPITASPNDYYIVADDGDGKSAGYVWSVIDSVEQWIKRYDVDWSFDDVLAEAYNSTTYVYPHKWGFTDRDENATPFAGDLAGQRLYGGDQANQHLILYANSGDAVGRSGFVQFGDDVRPLINNTLTLGTTTYRWADIYTTAATINTMSLATGSITDTTGQISFDNENLITTGNITGAVGTLTSATIATTLALASGSITDTTGAISFGDENLSTTGTLQSGSHTIGTLVLAPASITDTTGAINFADDNLLTTGTFGAGAITGTSLGVDDILINANQISINTLDTNLMLSANGTGIVNITSSMQTLSQQVTGTVTVTGQHNIDNLRLDGNTLSSQNANGNIQLSPNGAGVVATTADIMPSADNTLDLGAAGARYNDIFLGNTINNGTNAFVVSELMSLRNVVFRDLARTQPAQAGDGLFYDAVNNVWLADHPDTEITHSAISGLTTGDAGHTQFALLAGRAGGQALIGGTAASETLDLESTAHATKGLIRFKDDLVPFTNASYSAGWLGTDIGSPTNNIRHIHSKGEAKGFRFENYTVGTLPASSATSRGRAAFTTDTNRVYVDTGSAWVVVGGINKFISDVSFDGVQTVANVDVSSKITDARNATFDLLDNSNNFQKMYVTLEATSASNVRITTNLPLAAGSYRLIGLE